jgi:hypothetical protein
MKEAAAKIASDLLAGKPGTERVSGVNYDLFGASVVIDSDDDAADDDDDGCCGLGGIEAAEEEERELDTCVEAEGLGSKDGESPPAVRKKPASDLLPEPPNVAALLASVATTPHFDLAAAASSSAAPSSAATLSAAAAAAPTPAAVAKSGSPGGEVAKAPPAHRAGKPLQDPAEWNERHKELLERMPEEALPPSVPHGSRDHSTACLEQLLVAL